MKLRKLKGGICLKKYREVIIIDFYGLVHFMLVLLLPSASILFRTQVICSLFQVKNVFSRSTVMTALPGIVDNTIDLT